VQDARHHDVEVRTPCINTSGASSNLEWAEPEAQPVDDVCGAPCNVAAPDHRRRKKLEWAQPDLEAALRTTCEVARDEARERHPSAAAPDYPTGGKIPPQPAVRLGLEYVRGVGDDLARMIVEERDANGPFRSMEDLKRRVDMRAAAARKKAGLTLEHLEALATAGAFGCFDHERREALWSAGAVAQTGADRLEGVVTGVQSPPLPGMSPKEESSADLWATGVAPDGHPTRFIRSELDELGVVTAKGLREVDDGRKVLIGGVVTHRQRPATASGITFMNLEDETGLINVVCSRGCWNRYRAVARAPALLIRGRLEKVEGVINVVAEKLEPLPVVHGSMSRDFR
jgi:error-prone DNA polymerase